MRVLRSRTRAGRTLQFVKVVLLGVTAADFLELIDRFSISIYLFLIATVAIIQSVLDTRQRLRDGE
ncbi:hypothetical protein [Halosimplex sp. J119]